MKKKVVKKVSRARFTSAKEFSIGLVPMTLILAGLTLAFILLVTQAQNAAINQDRGLTVMTGEPAIKNTADLDRVTKELNNENVDSIDPSLSTLSSDTSGF